MPYNKLEQHLEYNREYYQRNKEGINQYRNIKHQCECGGTYTTRNQADHKARPKHIKWLEKQ